MSTDALKVLDTLVGVAKKGGGPAPLPLPPVAALQAFNALVEAHRQYQIIKEQEKTKRENIRAWKEVQITSIREQAAIIREYLERSFAERQRNFEQFFRILDEAIEANNPEAMQLALTGILELARQSPLRDAIEAARATTDAVYDPNIKRLEI